jgi:hypothetical protein
MIQLDHLLDQVILEILEILEILYILFQSHL